MLCVRKHTLFNKKYQLWIEENKIKIGQSKQNIKYLLECDLNQQIEWLMNDSQKNAKLIAFGFKYNGKMKWFHMQFEDLLKVKNELKNKISFTNIHSFYYPLNILGQGAQSKVILVKSFINYQPFASKQIEKCNGNQESKNKQIDDIYQEVEIMKTLNHPNIIKFEEFYVGDKTYHIITEYVRGGTLDNYIQKCPDIDNASIKLIMKQLLNVLAYLDTKNIIHRDIKPSNILIQDNNNIGTIKLIDFGFAINGTKQPFAHPKCGTPGYMAPEVIQLKSKDDIYTTKCDIFSAGSLMYKLITRKNLFPGRDSEQIYNVNKKCIYSLDLLKMFQHVPKSGKDLLARMLVLDVERRISALEALDHPYFYDENNVFIQQQSRKNSNREYIKLLFSFRRRNTK